MLVEFTDRRAAEKVRKVDGTSSLGKVWLLTPLCCLLFLHNQALRHGTEYGSAKLTPKWFDTRRAGASSAAAAAASSGGGGGGESVASEVEEQVIEDSAGADGQGKDEDDDDEDEEHERNWRRR